MRLNCISQEAWTEFNDKFPGAVLFLTTENLKGELRALEKSPMLNDWEKKRLEELRHISRFWK